MTLLHALGTAVPPYAHAQTTIQEFMARLLNLAPAEQERLAQLYARSGIHTRHSVIPDYGCPPTQRKLYPATPDLEPFLQLSQRMACFRANALPLALQAVADCFDRVPIPSSAITHLIAVTCTGLSAPGLDIMLLKALDLPPTTHRTGVYFMGCYAALHGLKIADAICRSEPQAVVLVVCVELCTLHFQKDPSPDNVMANMLFADGAAAALLTKLFSRSYLVRHDAPLSVWRGFQRHEWISALAETGWSAKVEWCWPFRYRVIGYV